MSSGSLMESTVITESNSEHCIYKSLNLKCDHCRKRNDNHCDMMVLANTMVGIILQYMCPKSTHLFTLTTHNVICLLYLIKAEKKKRGNCFNSSQIVRD